MHFLKSWFREVALRTKVSVLCSWLIQVYYARMPLSSALFLPLETRKKVLYPIVAHLSKGLETEKLVLPHDSNFYSCEGLVSIFQKSGLKWQKTKVETKCYSLCPLVILDGVNSCILWFWSTFISLFFVFWNVKHHFINKQCKKAWWAVT